MISNLKKFAIEQGYLLKPIVIISDFEQADINAYNNGFDQIVMKGCHFHFTQCLWKNIQKIGLVDEYNKADATFEWLNMFKSLAFIKTDWIPNAWNLILRFVPSLIKIKCPHNLWNHFYTEGPRTNNHVEGYNHKINNYINHTHPHIYSAIYTLKTLETSTGINFFQHESGGLTQFPRRPRDIQRDVMLNYLKFNSN
ncbi:unnamed protein product [Brachionus calyciflorus]|uniref:MULE transposase domain-containing protein n=1 Tax=Brachionus calyciflorus TaxID=104777 RepID=A0A814PGU5_9BILA|nr:unnamed protein product [Brachionus calyciflorus]